MKQIPVANLQAGAVLAEAVTDRSGKVLIEAGTALTDKHVNVLKTWGVGQVAIEDAGNGHPVANSSETTKERRIRAAAGIVSPRFALNDMKQGMIKDLYLQCVLKVAMDLKEGDL